MSSRAGRFIVASAVVLVLLGSPILRGTVWANNDKRTVVLLLKVLAYDRNLPSRVKARTITFGVLYPGTASSSSADKWRDVVRSLSRAEIQRKSVAAVSMAYHRERFAAQLADSAIDVLFVPDSLADEASAIARAAHKAGVLTVCEGRDMVAAGIAIGVADPTRRMRIVINLASARDIGVDLSARMLSLADVIGR